MSLKQKALSGLFWTLLQQFSSQGIAFLVQIILARLLMPQDFGLIAMISVLMGIGSILIQGGMSSSLIRTPNPDDLDYSTVFYFNLVSSFLIYGIAFFFANPIAVFYRIPLLESIIQIYSLTFVVSSFSSVQLTILQKEMNFQKELYVRLPSQILSSGVGIYMAYLGYGVWALVVSSLLQSTLVVFQLWLFGNWRPKWSFSWVKFHTHFHFGYKLTLSGILNTIFNNVYTLVIGKFYLPEQVGFYNRADQLQQFPVNNISIILNKITLPLFAEINSDDLRLKMIYKRIMKLVIFMVAPTLLIMAALGEPLFRAIFTDKWLEAVPYFRILCWAGILYPIHAYNLNVLNVKGRSDLFLKLEIIKKILSVIVILGTMRFGITTMLYGGVILSIFVFLINSYYTGMIIKYNYLEQFMDLIPSILIAALCATIVFNCDTVMSQMHFTDWKRLIIGSAIGLVLYVSVSQVFQISAFEELKDILKNKK